VTIRLVIGCDGTPGGPGTACPAEGRGLYPWHTTAEKIRRLLRSRGWHRTRDNRDVCPLCWDEGCYRPGCAPSPTWCADCKTRRPCWCDVDAPDPDPILLDGEDPENPWDGNPETAPEGARGAIGL